MTNHQPLSTREVSEELNRDRSAITRLVQAGKLEPLVKGKGLRGAMFFTREAIDTYKKSLSSDATPTNGATSGERDFFGGDAA